MPRKKTQWIVHNPPVSMAIGESDYELRVDKMEPLDQGNRAYFSLLNGSVQDYAEINIVDAEERERWAKKWHGKHGISESDIDKALLDLYEMSKAEIVEAPSSGPEEKKSGNDSVPYEETEHGLIWNQPVKEGTIPVQLCNFTARITVDSQRDDGLEKTRFFTIAAHVERAQHVFDIPASQFVSMGWPAEHLGSNAIIYPGFSKKDHARAAIQILSLKNVQRRTVYTHLGWRKIDDEWLYLHNGGAIGADGLNANIPVEVDADLARYTLPEPPQEDDLDRVALASVNFLALAPLEVTIPIFGAIWCAAIREGDMGLHLVGHTGEGKTAVATLAQQHYGTEMTSKRLPGSWTATANVLEDMAFLAKDALMVIDEFTPSTANSIKDLKGKAERVFRAQANGQARKRMRSDGSMRAARPPRGFVLSTGEDMPEGESLNARVLVIEVPRGSVDFNRLTKCQESAAAGDYAALMAAFVQWAAQHYQEITGGWSTEHLELRTAATEAGHRRVPENVAYLAMGWLWFVRFLVAKQVLSPQQAATVFAWAWVHLLRAGKRQARAVASLDPSTRFLDLLKEVLSTGRAYAKDADHGTTPLSNPSALGWRNVGSEGNPSWQARGEHIGWADSEYLYLLPAPTYAAVNRLAAETESALNVSERAIKKSLYESGHSVDVERDREKYTARKTCEGTRHDILKIPRVSPSEKPAQPAQPAQPGESKASGKEGWAKKRAGWAGSEALLAHDNILKIKDFEFNGPVGPVFRGSETAAFLSTLMGSFSWAGFDSEPAYPKFETGPTGPTGRPESELEGETTDSESDHSDNDVCSRCGLEPRDSDTECPNCGDVLV